MGKAQVGKAQVGERTKPHACLRRYKDYVHASHVEEDMSFWQVSGLRGLCNSPGDGRPSSSYATGPVLASSPARL